MHTYAWLRNFGASEWYTRSQRQDVDVATKIERHSPLNTFKILPTDTLHWNYYCGRAGLGESGEQVLDARIGARVMHSSYLSIPGCPPVQALGRPGPSSRGEFMLCTKIQKYNNKKKQEKETVGFIFAHLLKRTSTRNQIHTYQQCVILCRRYMSDVKGLATVRHERRGIGDSRGEGFCTTRQGRFAVLPSTPTMKTEATDSFMK